MDNTPVISPYYEIKVKNKNLTSSDMVKLQDIKFNDPIDGSKSIEFTIADPNYEFIGSDIYVKDTSVSASLGIPQLGYVETFEGYISAIDVTFPDNGVPTIAITCIDGFHLLNSKRKSRTWSNTTKVAVMKEVIEEHGFTFESEVIQKAEESIVQDDETDLEFIEKLKSDDGDDYRLSFKEDNKTVVYEKIDFKASSCGELNYRIKDLSIISFSPQVNKETKQTEVNDTDIDSEDKKTSSSTASSSNDDATTQGDPVEHNESAGNVTFDFNSQTYSINK